MSEQTKARPTNALKTRIAQLERERDALTLQLEQTRRKVADLVMRLESVSGVRRAAAPARKP